MSFWPFLFVTVPQPFLIFDEPDNFEKYWSSVLQNVFQFGIVRCFFFLHLDKSYRFGGERTDIKCHSHHIKGYAIKMTYHYWWWPGSWGWGGSSLCHFFTVKLLLHPVHTAPLRRKSPCTAQHPWEGGYHAQPTLNGVRCYDPPP